MHVGGLFGTGITPRNPRGGLDSISSMDVWIFFWVCEISAPPKKRPRKKPVFSGAPNLAKLENKKKQAKKKDSRSHIVFL